MMGQMNRDGLIVDCELSKASGPVEREAALEHASFLKAD